MNTLALTQVYTRRAFAALAAACALCVFLYATFLLLTVTHAAKRVSVERQVQSLSSEVSDMETQYLLATKDITPQKALALGFTTPSQVSTVFMAAGALSLNLR